MINHHGEKRHLREDIFGTFSKHLMQIQVNGTYFFGEDQTPPEARPLGGPNTYVLTRYDWRFIWED